MKCERCGNQLDDTDLFCPKCGKAVFEEYMDDDDIWDEYDREPKAEPEEELEVELERSKPVQPEQPSKTKEAEQSQKEENNKQEETEKIPQIPNEESKQKRKIEAKKSVRKTNKKANKTTNKNMAEASGKKSPVGLICACILMVCLLIGVLWGMLTVKQMDKEQAVKTTADNSQEQENQASASTDNTKTEEATKPEETEEAKPEETEETKTEEQEQQPEAKPEEAEQKKQDYFVMVDKDSVDFSQYTKLAVANAEQSSMASSDKYDYSAKSAVDGDITSSWQEGVDGLGEGTGIKLSLDGTHKIRYIVLYLGNWRSDEMWQKNARPAKLSINLGDNQSKDVEFSDEKKAFCLSFDEPVEASFVSLYIEAGYAGSKWNDNCISEVELYE